MEDQKNGNNDGKVMELKPIEEHIMELKPNSEYEKEVSAEPEKHITRTPEEYEQFTKDYEKSQLKYWAYENNLIGNFNDNGEYKLLDIFKPELVNIDKIIEEKDDEKYIANASINGVKLNFVVTLEKQKNEVVATLKLVERFAVANIFSTTLITPLKSLSGTNTPDFLFQVRKAFHLRGKNEDVGIVSFSEYTAPPIEVLTELIYKKEQFETMKAPRENADIKYISAVVKSLGNTSNGKKIVKEFVNTIKKNKFENISENKSKIYRELIDKLVQESVKRDKLDKKQLETIAETKKTYIDDITTLLKENKEKNAEVLAKPNEKTTEKTQEKSEEKSSSSGKDNGSGGSSSSGNSGSSSSGSGGGSSSGSSSSGSGGGSSSGSGGGSSSGSGGGKPSNSAPQSPKAEQNNGHKPASMPKPEQQNSNTSATKPEQSKDSGIQNSGKPSSTNTPKVSNPINTKMPQNQNLKPEKPSEKLGQNIQKPSENISLKNDQKTINIGQKFTNKEQILNKNLEEFSNNILNILELNENQKNVEKIKNENINETLKKSQNVIETEQNSPIKNESVEKNDSSGIQFVSSGQNREIEIRNNGNKNESLDSTREILQETLISEKITILKSDVMTVENHISTETTPTRQTIVKETIVTQNSYTTPQKSDSEIINAERALKNEIEFVKNESLKQSNNLQNLQKLKYEDKKPLSQQEMER